MQYAGAVLEEANGQRSELATGDSAPEAGADGGGHAGVGCVGILLAQVDAREPVPVQARTRDAPPSDGALLLRRAVPPPRRRLRRAAPGQLRVAYSLRHGALDGYNLLQRAGREERGRSLLALVPRV